MRFVHALVALGTAVAGLLANAAPAHADPAPPLVGSPQPLAVGCKLTDKHPYPVILVHGQAGNVEGMSGITDRLTREGFCVYATNYGHFDVVGGADGQAHLNDSGAQIASFIGDVLRSTGAKMADVVGHSAGTGVLDNVILAKGFANRIHSFVSFAGLHHPYWHLGVPQFFDVDIHLPNLILFGQKFFPFLTIGMITDVIAGMLDPATAATVKSPFVQDLFDSNYWNALHGGPSEPPGKFLKFMTRGRSLPTRDTVPGICYTSIVSVGDFLVGGSTGWLDQTTSTDNFLCTTAVSGNTHNDVLGNVDALNKMVEGLNRTCGNAAGLSTSSLSSLDLHTTTDADTSEAARAAKQKEFEEYFLEAVEQKYGVKRADVAADGEAADSNGCAVGARRDAQSALATGALCALGIVIVSRRRRK